MKTSFLIAGSLAVALTHGQAVRMSGSGGYGLDSPFNTQYRANRQIVFTGKVIGKSTFIPRPGMAPSDSIVVKVSGRKTYQVELGPQWYVSNQVAKIKLGDRVRVIGAPANFDGVSVILAKNVVNTKNLLVLPLRDMVGAPYWVAQRPAQDTTVPTNTIDGTVLSTNTTNYNGTPYVGYVLQTPTGNLNVLTAPQWYMQGQDYVINVGSNVRIVGGPAPVSLGNGVFLANSMYTNGSTITFMNNGVPVWYGYGNGPGR